MNRFLIIELGVTSQSKLSLRKFNFFLHHRIVTFGLQEFQGSMLLLSMFIGTLLAELVKKEWRVCLNLIVSCIFTVLA